MEEDVLKTLETEVLDAVRECPGTAVLVCRISSVSELVLDCRESTCSGSGGGSAPGCPSSMAVLVSSNVDKSAVSVTHTTGSVT